MNAVNSEEFPPIYSLEERISKLAPEKMLTFAAFCAQASMANVDHYLEIVKHPHRPLLNKWMDEWFWMQLEAKNISFPHKIDDIVENLLAFNSEIANYAKEKLISPAPSSVMVRETIFLFLKTCEFFAGRPNIAELLNCVDGCVSCKVDYYYDSTVGIGLSKIGYEELEGIYAFPVYSHVVADLSWVLDLLENDSNEWVSDCVLNAVRMYGKTCDSLVVRHAIYP